MKIVHLLSISFLSIASLSIFSTNSYAGYNCTAPNIAGVSTCSGTNSQGENFNIDTRSDPFGNTYINGTVGGSSINQTCFTNSFGMTSCNNF